MVIYSLLSCAVHEPGCPRKARKAGEVTTYTLVRCLGSHSGRQVRQRKTGERGGGGRCEERDGGLGRPCGSRGLTYKEADGAERPLSGRQQPRFPPGLALLCPLPPLAFTAAPGLDPGRPPRPLFFPPPRLSRLAAAAEDRSGERRGPAPASPRAWRPPHPRHSRPQSRYTPTRQYERSLHLAPPGSRARTSRSAPTST